MAIHNKHSDPSTWLHLIPGVLKESESSVDPSYTQRDPTPVDIDEDPFSHFLSPVLEDEDPFGDSDYTAGITPYAIEEDLKPTRPRARLEERWENYMAHRLLRRPSTTSSISQTRLATPPDEDQLPDLHVEDSDADIEPSSPPDFPFLSFHEDDVDGWEADRLEARGRLTSAVVPLKRPGMSASHRTLSGKKHVWREPSDDLWTLEEENEEDLMDDASRGRGRRRRRSKTVRWSEEVQVVEFER